MQKVLDFFRNHKSETLATVLCALALMPIVVPSTRHWFSRTAVVGSTQDVATSTSPATPSTQPDGTDKVGASTGEPQTPVASGVEERLGEMTNHIAAISLARDTAIREAENLRKRLATLEEQLDSQNAHLERSARVRPPTGSARAERLTSEPEKEKKKAGVPLLEYVWSSSDQVGSISLLGGEAAIVTITGGVEFEIDPDPGVVITVLIGNGAEITFAQWQKDPVPVRRFKISNDGSDPRIVLFTPK